MTRLTELSPSYNSAQKLLFYKCPRNREYRHMHTISAENIEGDPTSFETLTAKGAYGHNCELHRVINGEIERLE